MGFCILASEEIVETVTQTAYDKVPELRNRPLLNSPCSPTGEMPATHWFCCLTKASQDRINLLKEINDLSVMEDSSPMLFLKKHGLKPINRRKR